MSTHWKETFSHLQETIIKHADILNMSVTLSTSH